LAFTHCVGHPQPQKTLQVMGAGNASQARRSTLWFQAAKLGDEACLRRFLHAAAVRQIDTTDSRGATALMIAAANGQAGCLQMLIDAGCELDACDHRGWTATMHAAFAGQATCLWHLIQGGAYLDAQDFLGTTAVMRAAMRGSTACVHLLLEHGASRHVADQMGFTAAMHAKRRGLPCEQSLEASSKAVSLHPCLERTSSKGSSSTQDIGSYRGRRGSRSTGEKRRRSSDSRDSHGSCSTSAGSSSDSLGLASEFELWSEVASERGMCTSW